MSRTRRSNSRTKHIVATRGRGLGRGLFPLPARVFLSAALLLGLLCGCKSEPGNGAMANSYYLNPHKDLRRLGRVALAELNNQSGHSEISAEMTEALFVAVQKEQVFGLTVVRQDNQDWHSLQENLDSLQALRQLLSTRESLNCNGLLVGTVTRYEPYPHIVIGLRLKLLDFTDGQLAWGLEQVWDGADRSVQKRIKEYVKQQTRSGSAQLQEELAVVSSISFAKFVAYEVARTLERDHRK
jgi:hypothetical protein